MTLKTLGLLTPPALAFTMAVVACSAPPLAAPAPAAKPLTSGIETSAIDKAVRPQDDLFQHANGVWLAKNEIPADKSSYGSFDALFDQSQVDLRAIMEAASKAPNRPAGSEEQKIGDFYDSFMDEARVEQVGLEPLKAEMAAVDALKTPADLAKYFAHAAKINLTHPFNGFVDGDAQQPDQNILYLVQSGIGLPDREYYFNREPEMVAYREKYVGYLSTILKAASQPASGAREVFDLETRLAKAHWTNVESRDAVKTYNKVTLADLPRKFPGFDWATWASELGIAGAPNIIVSQPSYFAAFAASVSQIPMERWRAYLKTGLIRDFGPYLSKAFQEPRFDFYGRTMSGVKEQQPRWKRAVNTVSGNLGEMVGKHYVAKHFKPEAKARMQELVENMRLAYKDGIERLEWMGADTKKQAQDKLAKFRPKVGYPNKWRDYSRVEIKKDDLLGNVSRAFIVENEFQLAKVGKPVDVEEWGMTPQTINAYYNPVRNEIVFPAAILQPPFFNLEADDAVNYGAIGGVIGHEMGHGFDDQGRRFDGNGVLRDWWTKEDEAEYMKRAKMLVAQYAEFEPLPNLHVNGELTLGENIGDLTGIVIAHRAYMLALKGQPPPELDGMPAEQRYYLGWAQAWRGKMRDDAMRQQVMANPHAPDMYRANGPLRNVLEFYNAFGVKEGDKMFLPPEKRVKIW